MSIRFVDGPAEGKSLMLARAPLFLRVTFDALLRKWDALDQLSDRPNPAEAVFVYKRLGAASCGMIDYTEGGRRRGGKFAFARYAVYHVQPADDVLRDSAKWRAWCWEQVGREPTGEPKAAATEKVKQ